MGKLDITQRYDLLIYLVEESGLSPDEQKKGVIELFPALLEEVSYNDKFLSDYVIEKYAYGRSIGLSVTDSAHSAEISLTLFNKVREGEGLSLERFLSVAKAELYASALMKRKHLANLDDSSTGGKYQASIAFLEKIYPDQYGQRVNMQVEEVVDEKKPRSKMELARCIAYMLTQGSQEKTVEEKVDKE